MHSNIQKILDLGTRPMVGRVKKSQKEHYCLRHEILIKLQEFSLTRSICHTNSPKAYVFLLYCWLHTQHQISPKLSNEDKQEYCLGKPALKNNGLLLKPSIPNKARNMQRQNDKQSKLNLFPVSFTIKHELLRLAIFL